MNQGRGLKWKDCFMINNTPRNVTSMSRKVKQFVALNTIRVTQKNTFSGSWGKLNCVVR